MKNYINLVPWSIRRKRLIRRRLQQWSFAWAAVAACCAVWFWSDYTACEVARRHVEARQAQYAPVKKMMYDTRECQEAAEKLKQREVVLDELRVLRPPLTATGLISQSAEQTQGRVRVESLTLQERPVSAPPETLATLAIEGVGLDNAAVATFVNALRETNRFHDVELKSTIRHGAGLDRIRRFSIECQY